jgi:hypothetical protein
MSEDNEKNKDFIDKQEFKFSDLFTGLLNISALFIIIAIIAIFLSFLINDNFKKDDEKISDIKEEFKFTGNEKIDVEKFNELIDKRFIDYKKQIKISEKERNEDFRYYATLIGFVFSIVGFFGFKSIHDTRQSAIEKAVFDAKKEAKDEASSVAKKTAIDTVKEEIIGLAKVETNAYLDLNLEKHFEKIETDILNDFTDRVSKIELDVNKLTRPESFNENERPKIFNDINEELKRLNISIENLKNEMFNFKNEELKRSIISELKKEQK